MSCPGFSKAARAVAVGKAVRAGRPKKRFAYLVSNITLNFLFFLVTKKQPTVAASQSLFSSTMPRAKSLATKSA